MQSDNIIYTLLSPTNDDIAVVLESSMHSADDVHEMPRQRSSSVLCVLMMRSLLLRSISFVLASSRLQAMKIGMQAQRSSPADSEVQIAEAKVSAAGASHKNCYKFGRNIYLVDGSTRCGNAWLGGGTETQARGASCSILSALKGSDGLSKSFFEVVQLQTQFLFFFMCFPPINMFSSWIPTSHRSKTNADALVAGNRWRFEQHATTFQCSEMLVKLQRRIVPLAEIKTA
jgi:hypothetical protein